MRSEGDRWFDRNRDRLGVFDPVSDMIQDCGLRPKAVLEIGCSNGWRLAKLRDIYGCDVLGVEPSAQAARAAAEIRVPVFGATAAALPVLGGKYDMIIYGFCLYLVDADDWFKVVAEGDRVLKAGGYLVIHDFDAHSGVWAKHYEHCDGVLAYHLDFARFWEANPLYTRISRRRLPGSQMITLLHKRPAAEIRVFPTEVCP